MGTRLGEAELGYQWRTLIEIGIANPPRTHNEVDNSWPRHPRGTVSPNLEVRLLVPLQFRWFEFRSLALILNGLLASTPSAYDERAGGLAIRFGYLRELLTVSKITSSCGVIAIPIRAD